MNLKKTQSYTQISYIYVYKTLGCTCIFPLYSLHRISFTASLCPLVIADETKREISFVFRGCR